MIDKNSNKFTSDSGFLTFKRSIKSRIFTAHNIANIALQSYKSSTKILSLTWELKLASLNIFIKTERASDNSNNIFAPISHEFMNLVKNYGKDTSSFGTASIEFVACLVSYVKLIRKYDLFVEGIYKLIYGWEDLSNTELKKEIFNAILETHVLPSKTPELLKERLSTAWNVSRDFQKEMFDSYSKVRRVYHSLRVLDRNLLNLSNIGEFATQLAKTEAARLEKKEDLVASFDEIHNILNTSLQELEKMRTYFQIADRNMSSLNWEI